MTALRILLADDHALVRAGLRELLLELPGIEIAGEAGDGYEAMRLIAETQPDVALIDVSMPGLNGLEVAGRIVKEHPRTRVLILSMHTDEEYVRRALLLGAAGYISKNADREELSMAVRAVARGETWLSPAISGSVVTALREGPGQPGPFEELTARQREVLQLIAEGYSSKEIAQRLGLSARTVETHRAQMMERLGIRGIPALVRYAIRAGIVRPEP